jgi:superoxide reductase
MAEFQDLYQTADWKDEKHVPVIDCESSLEKGQFTNLTVTIGKEVAHPNKTEHYISWVDVYFKPEGGKFPYQIGKTSFDAHGASTEGADTSGVYTHHSATLSFKTEKPGTILALTYCNIHGLWRNSKDVSVK